MKPMGPICPFELADDVATRLSVWCKHETIGIRVYRGGKALYRASWLRVGTDITIVHFPVIYSEIRRVGEKKTGLEWIQKVFRIWNSHVYIYYPVDNNYYPLLIFFIWKSIRGEKKARRECGFRKILRCM